MSPALTIWSWISLISSRYECLSFFPRLFSRKCKERIQFEPLNFHDVKSAPGPSPLISTVKIYLPPGPSALDSTATVYLHPGPYPLDSTVLYNSSTQGLLSSQPHHYNLGYIACVIHIGRLWWKGGSFLILLYPRPQHVGIVWPCCIVDFLYQPWLCRPVATSAFNFSPISG